jgi:hypothetical protein
MRATHAMAVLGPLATSQGTTQLLRKGNTSGQLVDDR